MVGDYHKHYLAQDCGSLQLVMWVFSQWSKNNAIVQSEVPGWVAATINPSYKDSSGSETYSLLSSLQPASAEEH